MSRLLNPATTRVLVVEPAGTIRMMLAEVLKECGYHQVLTTASLKDALQLMEIESVHWVVTPLLAHEDVNTLHLLQTILEEPLLRHTRVSLFIDPAQESWCLSQAFESGLLSFHKRSYAKEAMHSEIVNLEKTDVACAGDATLIAAHYLRGFLTEKRHVASLLAFERNLLAMYPGSPHVLLNLAEAELLTGAGERALILSNQAELIDQRMANRAQILRERISGTAGAGFVSGKESEVFENVLGLKNVVVIDPDTDVLHAVREMLGVVGVKNVETFEDGEAAASHLKGAAEPDLILMEWRIPRVAGPILVQRIRQQGFLTVPIIVMSSLTNREDKPLLREMSIDDVLSKPFDRQTFFSALIWTIQQNQCPTEQKSMDRKIRRLLTQGRSGEAQRLVAQVLIDPRIGDGFKKEIAAEFEYSVGNYQSAAKLAAEALKIGGDSISLLNLLGKALYQLKQYEGALKCFEKGHVLSPMNIEKLLNIAELRLEIGRPTEAVVALREAEEIDCQNPALAPAQAKVAFERGKIQEASGLMAELESGNRLVAYMNNRAVLLTLSGRFEDGIALYERALAAIPEKWRGLRDTVAYNCALAHARYGDYEQCLKMLKGMSPGEESLEKKVRSLGTKVQGAKKGKYTLQLNENEERPLSSSVEDAAVKHTDFEELVAKVEAKRGDLCAYLVYHHVEGHDAKVADALKDQPRFKTRPAIGRSASLNGLKKAG